MNVKHAIVVGGGMAGLAAAHTIIQRGGNVLLLDKNPFLGGNSTKATSGINGALTKTQIKHGVQDSDDLFAMDTAKGSKIPGGVPTPLQKTLTGESASAIEWLIQHFGLDLSLVSQLGGHSVARTHRGKEKFPGMSITYALMEHLEKIQVETKGKRAQIVTKAKVTNLIYENNEVVGVEYEKDGKKQKSFGPVVIATGGFGADFTENSILSKVRPDLLKLSTTNGAHCTGDGIKMAESVGATTVDMEHVQVHPTGLVDPADPESKVKFLAAEALRGVGGILLNRDGERFVDEMQTRDYVSEQMNKNKGPFRLVLNGKASAEIAWHCRHYVGRGLMKKLTGPELAKEIGIPVSKLETVFRDYNEGAKNKSDPFGKKYFTNLPFEINDTFHIAQVCPLIHYCMGGLLIDTNGSVVSKDGKPIPGLFACGEVTGGVHHRNRLGGSSLTDCIVFGRVSGAACANHLLSSLLTKGGAGHFLPSVSAVPGSSSIEFSIKQHPIQTNIQINPQGKNVSMNIHWSESGVPTVVSATDSATSSSTVETSSSEASSASTEESAPKKQLKVYTAEEVAKHNKEGDCWVIVHGQVLDVTHFLKNHPGGAKAILIYAGKDATEEFDMLHDRNVVEKFAPETIIGTLAGSSEAAASTPSSAAGPEPSSSGNTGSVSQATAHYTQPNNPVSLDPVTLPTPSNVKSRHSGGTADILPDERKRSTFDVNKMINFLDGGEENTNRKHFIRGPVVNRDVSDMHNWDRQTLIGKHIEHFIGIHKKFAKYKPTRQELAWMSDYSMLKGSLMNHHALFMLTLQGMATEEQKGWWIPRALSFKIIGCYAQTELGHGSNVRGLETVAIYDKATQEFVVDTPTLTSMKWWPGTLGKLCTHALVYAQLILDGKEYGVHVFMVQIRDENHRPLKGVEVGDLGTKMGDNANDTGFLRLNQVRIPREYMLAGLNEVTVDGNYAKTPRKTNPKMHYATMMYTRGLMISIGAGTLAKAAIIATRYSCIRRQGFVDPSSDVSYKTDEFPIIDHQIQRYRVFRQISLVYALKLTSHWMLNKFAELEQGNDMAVIVDTSALPVIAATSAGLKALSTFMVANGIEDLRKCCGGNGYLMNSGIAPLASDYVWQTTAEGDFVIMMLLTARFLLKSLQSAMKGTKQSGPVEYLNAVAQPGFNIASQAPQHPNSVNGILNIGYLINLYKFRALSSVLAVGSAFESKVRKGANFMDAWNTNALELYNAVKAHCMYFILLQSAEKLNEAKDPAVSNAVKNLVFMFAISNILDDNWAGLLSMKQLQLVKAARDKLLNDLRPDAVALVDAFDIPDNVLNSAIGRYDGNIYEALFESALKSDLNKRDPFDGYNEYLRPHLDLEFLKLKNSKL